MLLGIYILNIQGSLLLSKKNYLNIYQILTKEIKFKRHSTSSFFSGILYKHLQTLGSYGILSLISEFILCFYACSLTKSFFKLNIIN